LRAQSRRRRDGRLAGPERRADRAEAALAIQGEKSRREPACRTLAEDGTGELLEAGQELALGERVLRLATRVIRPGLEPAPVLEIDLDPSGHPRREEIVHRGIAVALAARHQPPY